MLFNSKITSLSQMTKFEQCKKICIFTYVRNWIKYTDIGCFLYSPILWSSVNRVKLASYLPLKHEWYRSFHPTLGKKNENNYNSQNIKLCFLFFSMAFSSWQCYLLASINHHNVLFYKGGTYSHFAVKP